MVYADADDKTRTDEQNGETRKNGMVKRGRMDKMVKRE